MTIKTRILQIRIAERMKEMYEKGADCIVKAEDGTLKYVTENGKVMISSK